MYIFQHFGRGESICPTISKPCPPACPPPPLPAQLDHEYKSIKHFSAWFINSFHTRFGNIHRLCTGPTRFRERVKYAYSAISVHVPWTYKHVLNNFPCNVSNSAFHYSLLNPALYKVDFEFLEIATWVVCVCVWGGGGGAGSAPPWTSG